MIQLSIKTFIKLFRYHKRFAILSVLCLSLATLSFLVLVEKALYVYNSTRSQEFLYVESTNHETIVSIYQEIISDKTLPRYISISLIGDDCTGIDYDENTFHLYMPYGRSFTNNELSNGNYTAMISMEYVRNLPYTLIDKIWDYGIEVKGNLFSVIGSYTDIARYFSVHELALNFPVPTLITIPIKAFLNLEIKATMMNCQFSDILSNNQMQHILNILQKYPEIQNYYVPGQNQNIRQYLANTLSVYSLILLIALLAVSTIMITLYQSEYKRYLVYLMLGAKRKHIVILSFLNVLYIHMCAYVLSGVILCILNLFFSGITLSPLPFSWYILFTFGILIISIFSFTPHSIFLLSHTDRLDQNEV